MKKNFFYAMMSAIALTSAVSFTACSSDDGAVADPNPTYDGSTVKTQFSISLPGNVVKNTRMAYSTVQEAQVITSFRGMSDIVLIPYSNATDRTARFGGNITLGAGKMVKPNASNSENAIPSYQLLANSNAVLYKDVTIPVSTAGFLFYGKATGTDGSANGSLTPAGLTGESSGISFTPTPILGWNTTTGEPNTPDMTIGNALATYVSLIAAASSDNGTTDNTEDDIPNIWAKCANSANSTQSWYNSGLGQMYTAFTSMRAGSSSYVLAAVQDLYSSIKDNTDKVSVAIKKAILNDTYVTESEETLTLKENYRGYPANINMPEGAAALSWSNPDNAAAPKAATAVGGSNFGHTVEAPATAMNVVNMTNIVYPASLYYYVDSPIKTSNASRVNDYDGILPWTKTGDNNDILDKYTDGTSVQPATRSVAIVNSIQYAVGRLDVKVNPLKETIYYDRKGEEVSTTYAPDPTTPTTTAPAFQLTGVLIGGQKAVGYDFTPNGSTEYTIYDNVINNENGVSAIVPTTTGSYAGPTYTLALETEAETPVYVALEFVNNSNDFQGYDGVIKHGCTFYMIAQLDPTADVDNKVSGVDKTGKKVFKQDFNTIANFTIATGTTDGDHDGVADTPAGFANAYTTIPDLRTPKLELGFSVDLTWQAGIQFDVTF